MLLPAVLGVGLPVCLLHHYNFPTLPLSILISLLCNLIFLLAFFEPVNHRSVWFKPMLKHQSSFQTLFRATHLLPISTLPKSLRGKTPVPRLQGALP